MEISTNIFFGYLPFNSVMKLFIIYMNEGISVYFRAMYSLMKMLKIEILNITDMSSLKNTIRDLGINFSPQ